MPGTVSCCYSMGRPATNRTRSCASAGSTRHARVTPALAELALLLLPEVRIRSFHSFPKYVSQLSSR